MKDYAHLLKDDPAYAEKATRFSSKVKDVMEFFAEQKPQLNFKLELEPELTTYHDACHLIHAQKISSQPR
jgi:glycolate oxidase iron-sulfur subunit